MPESKEDLEIQYVSAKPLDPEDPNYAEFAKIFQHFMPAEELVLPPSTSTTPTDSKKRGIEQITTEVKLKKDPTTSLEALLEATEDGKKTISKKEKKRQKRLEIAVLKQLVHRPDVVEIHDVNAADPLLLASLKAHRNSVPVPRHWSQKRKYLQGKRGFEKVPFQLPDFIANTGIAKLREAVQDNDDAKKTKTKQRERMQPKMGKLDIDYQVLHDAFFRHQTKPKLTIHGDLYYEGKEFEVKLKEKKPGQLSPELKKALGMPEGAPPPWLINMQRYGPPPSYPNLKIPGLNAPIPAGAMFGYHPGGWGKPPVDENGRPLYGDVFGTATPAPEISEVPAAPIERNHWGELEEEEEEEEESTKDGQYNLSDEEEEREMEPQQVAEGIASVPSGLETPDAIELRKTAKKDKDEPKSLFQVLDQTDLPVGGSVYGSSHKYVIPSGDKAKEPKSKDKVDLMKSQKTDKVSITLNPSDLETMDELNTDVIKEKYEQVLAERENQKEDVSDIIAEQERKKRKKDKKDGKSKKYKDFKF